MEESKLSSISSQLEGEGAQKRALFVYLFIGIYFEHLRRSGEKQNQLQRTSHDVAKGQPQPKSAVGQTRNSGRDCHLHSKMTTETSRLVKV